MQRENKDNYIELRVNRDFGDMITLYFDFFKQNLKKFTNIFIGYNGIFLIGLLLVSYLLVSGVIGLISNEQNTFLDGVGFGTDAYLIYFGLGGVLFFFIFLMVAILNYSLSTSYMIKYEEYKGQGFNKEEVWQQIKSNLGNIVLFILLILLLFVLLMVVAFILAFIPLVGMLAQYVLQYFIMAWVGVSFFVMLKEKRGIIEALGEGWNLVTKNFWTAVGVNFILGLLIGLLIMVVMIIPGILVGIYTFHVVQNDVALGSSIVPTIIYTLGTCMFLIIAVYSQCLSQFINGLLYFSLHEKMYNLNSRSKIDQIGLQDQ
ncbi:hypothetical protein EHW67_10445 [Arenibacter aquaticus]|uniref:Glycerophosphoryl diester phosphodiesterase membrane domain-containing protein n=1 Tax=Arenibacter aquaticus TaxID=2489054 RepID=A0A3S0AE26_9FLAO|nr:hypothetical protein [Arenibacter aquaticus]RTE53433.1 hypothetical protein EHW67_10445 [Arenibacter aquaticus]